MTPAWLLQRYLQSKHAARVAWAEIDEPHAVDDVLVRLLAADLAPVELRLDHRLEILQRVGRSMVLQRILPERAGELVLMDDDLRLAEIFHAACVIAMQMRKHDVVDVVGADAHHVEPRRQHAFLAPDMREEFLQSIDRPAPVRTTPIRVAARVEQDIAVRMFDIIGGDGNIDEVARAGSEFSPSPLSCWRP